MRSRCSFRGRGIDSQLVPACTFALQRGGHLVLTDVATGPNRLGKSMGMARNGMKWHEMA